MPKAPPPESASRLSRPPAQDPYAAAPPPAAAPRPFPGGDRYGGGGGGRDQNRYGGRDRYAAAGGDRYGGGAPTSRYGAPPASRSLAPRRDPYDPIVRIPPPAAYPAGGRYGGPPPYGGPPMDRRGHGGPPMDGRGPRMDGRGLPMDRRGPPMDGRRHREMERTRDSRGRMRSLSPRRRGSRSPLRDRHRGRYYEGSRYPRQTSGEPREGTVVFLTNLNESKLTPKKLYNLVSVYGDVLLVKIFFTSRDKALVQMASESGANAAVSKLDGACKLYGRTLQVKMSNKTNINALGRNDRPEYRRLVADFTRSDVRKRWGHTKRARARPGPLLFVYGLFPGCRERDLMMHFREQRPVGAQIGSKSARVGFVRFSNVEDALEAIVEKYDSRLNGINLRIEFSEKHPESVRPFQGTLPPLPAQPADKKMPAPPTAASQPQPPTQPTAQPSAGQPVQPPAQQQEDAKAAQAVAPGAGQDPTNPVEWAKNFAAQRKAEEVKAAAQAVAPGTAETDGANDNPTQTV